MNVSRKGCHTSSEPKPNEVVAMNALTVNLHLLLVKFYRPSGKRTVLCEAKAFPTDQCALASQVRFHGGDPAVDIIEVAPREGSSVIEEADIEAILHDRGDEIALVMMGGVQYFTGQWLDMPRITAAAHTAGALCGVRPRARRWKCPPGFARLERRLRLLVHIQVPQFWTRCGGRCLCARAPRWR